MNILQIISKLDSSDPAQDAISSTRAFTLKGHKVIVVSPKSPLVKEIDEVGARYRAISITSNIFLIPMAIFRLSQIISKENIQIVHARDGISSFVAFFASRLTDTILVTTAYRHSVKSLFDRSQFWAKRVICFSESEARRLTKNNLVPHNKLRVVEPFIDGDKIACLRLDNPRGYFVIGAVIPLFSHESVQNFIRTVSILSRTIHKIKVFVADSSFMHGKDHVEKLKLLIRRHSLSDVVTFLSDPEDMKLMFGVDLSVQINVDENISARPLLQAQACGIPVVATRADWVKDYLEDNRTAITCQAGNPRDLATTILDLYRDEKRREEIKNAAKDFVKEKFNIKKVTQSTLNLYEDTLSSMNILIIKIGALGDVILATPSIRAVREKFPKSKIKLLIDLDNREVFMNSPFVDEMIVCDFRQRDKALGGLLRVARKLRAEGFDTVIDLQNNKKSHLLSFLSSAPKRYGYDNGKLSFLLNRKIKDANIPMDPVEHQSKVLGLLGIYEIDKSLELWPTKEDEAWARNFLESHWVKGNTKLVAFNIGSSPRWITKLWPVENFVEICNRLGKDFGIRVILIGRDKSEPRIDDFLRDAKSKPIKSLGKTNIPRLASLIKRCDLLLSSDSAPIHVAASVKTPFIALFGPTDPRRHVAPVNKYVIIKKDFPCIPCYRTHCDRGYVCMRSIKPDEVYNKIIEMLKVSA